MSKNDTVELDKKQVKALRAQIELEKELTELQVAQVELKDKKRSSRRYKYTVDEQEAEETRRGIFRMYGVVDWRSCETLEREILSYCHRNPGAPVTLIIRTPGGEVLSGLALYDSLRTLADEGHHITTIGRGMVASFGAILLQAGDTRLLGKESYLLLHELSAGVGGKMHEMRQDTKTFQKMDRRLNKILTRRSEMTAEELGKMIEAKDVWLPAKAAIRSGFADEIG